jgi:hypothetical protein
MEDRDWKITVQNQSRKRPTIGFRFGGTDTCYPSYSGDRGRIIMV